jgi:hypothetical protein
MLKRGEPRSIPPLQTGSRHSDEFKMPLFFAANSAWGRRGGEPMHSRRLIEVEIRKVHWPQFSTATSTQRAFFIWSLGAARTERFREREPVRGHRYPCSRLCKISQILHHEENRVIDGLEAAF